MVEKDSPTKLRLSIGKFEERVCFMWKRLEKLS